MDRLRLVRLPTRSAGEPNPMTIDRIALKELVEKGSDADLLREMIAFIASRMMELEVEGLTGASHGQRSPNRINQRNGYREWTGRRAPAP